MMESDIFLKVFKVYINANCPYCRRNIKKVGISVIKPGIVTCPGCMKMSTVNGLGFGMFAYTITAVIMAVIWKNILYGYRFEIKLIVIVSIIFIAGFVMSLFLDLKK